MDDSEYYQIDRVEETHFWYRAMEQLALDTIQAAYPGGSGMILDAGCGPGGMTQRLSRFGQVVGIDIHPTAHVLARRRVDAVRPSMIMGDVCALPLHAEHFDLVTVFDVLYNQAVADDSQAIAELFRVLKPGGLLYLREPALEGLRGDHDLVVKTRQRYTTAEIRQRLTKAGFSIQKISYANMILGIRSICGDIFSGKRKGSKRCLTLLRCPTAINRLLFFILHTESRLLKTYSLPFGSSVICLAAKPTRVDRYTKDGS